MKALSLWQPWATLVAILGKRNETRGWATTYRGPLAIHAAAKFPPAARQLVGTFPFDEVLRRAGCPTWRELPLGAVVAIAELVDVVRIDGQTRVPGGNEFMFGDYRRGRYIWRLGDVRKLPAPVPATGALGLWSWTPPAEAAA
jgi:hypothetical protein